MNDNSPNERSKQSRLKSFSDSIFYPHIPELLNLDAGDLASAANKMKKSYFECLLREPKAQMILMHYNQRNSFSLNTFFLPV